MLRTLRKDRCLTQAELGRRVGISRRQISRLENEVAIPTEQQRAVLEQFFDCPMGWTNLKSRPIQSRWPPGFLKRHFGSAPEMHRAARPVSMYARLKAAVEERPYLAKPAAQALADKGFGTLVRSARSDSKNEAETFVWLFQRKARFARTTMTRLHWRGRRVMEPGWDQPLCGRLWPVLYVEKPVPMVFFSQVWLRTPFGARRVDILTAISIDEERGWFALEVIGEGHDSERDHLRPMEIGMPVVQVFVPELPREDLLDLIIARYRVARDSLSWA